MTGHSPSSHANWVIPWLIFCLFLFLPIQFGKHFWPSSSFVLGQRIDYLSPTLYTTDIVTFLIIAFSIQRLRLTKIKWLVLVGIVLFLLVGILLSPFSSSVWLSMVKFLEMSLLGLSVYFFPRQSFLKKSWILVVPLLIGITAESILALFQYIHQGSLGGLFYFLGERSFSGTTPGIANASIGGNLILRPYGTFPHPNVLGGYLLLSILLVLEFTKNLQKKSFFILVVAIVCIGSFGIFLSLSRMAIFLWTVIVLCSIGNLWLQGQSKQKALLLLVLGILFVFLVSFLLPIGGRFGGFSPMDESIIQRQILVKASVDMFLAHPLFGVGIGNFLRALPFFEPLQTLPFILQPVHNIFLLTVSETGIIGLFIFAWFVGGAVKKVFLHWKSQTFLGLAFFSILFIGLFDHYLFTLQQGQLLFTLVMALVYKEI